MLHYFRIQYCVEKFENRLNKLRSSETEVVPDFIYIKLNFVTTTKYKKNMNSLTGRQLDDCPFYHYKYGSDSLPLDPAKSFIIEKMCT